MAEKVISNSDFLESCDWRGFPVSILLICYPYCVWNAGWVTTTTTNVSGPAGFLETILISLPYYFFLLADPIFNLSYTNLWSFVANVNYMSSEKLVGKLCVWERMQKSLSWRWQSFFMQLLQKVSEGNNEKTSNPNLLCDDNFSTFFVPQTREEKKL